MIEVLKQREKEPPEKAKKVLWKNIRDGNGQIEMRINDYT
jgi:hypothetical protein